jgi:hypothetical protein
MYPFSSAGRLNIDANGFYSYTSGTPTKLQRKIIITCLPTGNCATDYIMKVVVQVSWDKKATILNPSFLSASTCSTFGNNNCTTVEETLYDWYNYQNH